MPRGPGQPHLVSRKEVHMQIEIIPLSRRIGELDFMAPLLHALFSLGSRPAYNPYHPQGLASDAPAAGHPPIAAPVIIDPVTENRAVGMVVTI